MTNIIAKLSLGKVHDLGVHVKIGNLNLFVIKAFVFLGPGPVCPVSRICYPNMLYSVYTLDTVQYCSTTNSVRVHMYTLICFYVVGLPY